jgi:hypothetical protein
MVSANQIRESVSSYLSHNDAERFVREFAALAYNIHKNGDPEAIDLARAVEFKMADLRSGCIDKPSFLVALWNLIAIPVQSNTRVFAQFCDPVNSPVQVDPGFQGWAASFGTLPAVVFGSVRLVQS